MISPTNIIRLLAFSGLALALGCTSTTARRDSGAQPDWVAKSDEYFDGFVRARAQYQPNIGSHNGMREYDSQADAIVDDIESRDLKLAADWREKAQAGLRDAKDPELKADLKLFLHYLEQMRDRLELTRKYGRILMPAATRTVHNQLAYLINEQSLSSQKRAAVQRFHAIVNGHGEYKPYLLALKSRILFMERNAPGHKPVWPIKVEIEKYLNESAAYLTEIRERLQESKVSGWEADYEAFVAQAKEFDDFLREHVLPKARPTFRLPREIYQSELRQHGIEDPPEVLIREARQEYVIRYKELQEKSREVAKKNGLPKSDIRSVLEFLKKDQAQNPDQARKLYEKATADLENLIQANDLVTLPNKPIRIRVLDDEETREHRVPAYECQTRENNRQGLQSELQIPGKPVQPDVGYAAAALPLAAHEARPGHDLECVHKRDAAGNSKFRDGNGEAAEGWALYAERLVYPYLPPESQFAALRMYLLRLTRSFLDPELHLGKIDEKGAKKLLVQDLAYSEDWATIELNRHMFQMPAQGPSYFHGLQHIEEVKARMRRQLADQFVERCFNDAILDYSFLPLSMIEERVSDDALARGTLCRVPAPVARQ